MAQHTQPTSPQPNDEEAQGQEGWGRQFGFQFRVLRSPAAPDLRMSHRSRSNPPGASLQRRGRRNHPFGAIRQGVGLPMVARDGACGSARASCWKPPCPGRQTTRPKPLSAEEEAAGQRPDPDRCARPETDCVRSRRAACPVPASSHRQAAHPGDQHRAAGDDVALLRMQRRPISTSSPARASTSSSSCATARRSYRWPTPPQPDGPDRAAHPPHAGRQVHRPRLPR